MDEDIEKINESIFEILTEIANDAHLSKFKDGLESLQKFANDRHKELSKLNTKLNEELICNLESISHHIESIANDANTRESRSNSLVSSVERLRLDIGKNTDRIHTNQSNLDNFTKEHKKAIIHTEIEKMKIEDDLVQISHLQSTLSNTAKTLAEARRKSQSLDEETYQLSRQHFDMTNIHENLNDESKSLVNRENDLETKLNNFELDRSNLEKSIESIKKDLLSASGDLFEMNSKIKDQNGELRSIDDNIGDQTRHISEYSLEFENVRRNNEVFLSKNYQKKTNQLDSLKIDESRLIQTGVHLKKQLTLAESAFNFRQEAYDKFSKLDDDFTEELESVKRALNFARNNEIKLSENLEAFETEMSQVRKIGFDENSGVQSIQSRVEAKNRLVQSNLSLILNKNKEIQDRLETITSIAKQCYLQKQKLNGDLSEIQKKVDYSVNVELSRMNRQFAKIKQKMADARDEMNETREKTNEVLCRKNQIDSENISINTESSKISKLLDQSIIDLEQVDNSLLKLSSEKKEIHHSIQSHNAMTKSTLLNVDNFTHKIEHLNEKKEDLETKKINLCLDLKNQRQFIDKELLPEVKSCQFDSVVIKSKNRNLLLKHGQLQNQLAQTETDIHKGYEELNGNTKIFKRNSEHFNNLSIKIRENEEILSKLNNEIIEKSNIIDQRASGLLKRKTLLTNEINTVDLKTVFLSQQKRQNVHRWRYMETIFPEQFNLIDKKRYTSSRKFNLRREINDWNEQISQISKEIAKYEELLIKERTRRDNIDHVSEIRHQVELLEKYRSGEIKQMWKNSLSNLILSNRKQSSVLSSVDVMKENARKKEDSRRKSRTVTRPLIRPTIQKNKLRFTGGGFCLSVL